jgi:hypothetical protein
MIGSKSGLRGSLANPTAYYNEPSRYLDCNNPNDPTTYQYTSVCWRRLSQSKDSTQTMTGMAQLALEDSML